MESVVNYQNGNKEGSAFFFFENRKVKKELEYITVKSTPETFVSDSEKFKVRLVYQADSLGNEQVKEGNGYLKEITFIDGDSLIEEGKYKNGYKDSLWLGRYASGKSSYQEMYAMEKLVWGKNTVGDNTYDYSGNEGPPQFKDGMKGFYTFIARTLRYPPEAVRYNVQGTVLASFTITKEGKIEDINILKSPDLSTGQEVIRILTLSPKWIPGKQRGVPVKVKYTIPVSFRLSI
jgi:TonB family protein